jgi:DNA-binding response OmpR family regulator
MCLVSSAPDGNRRESLRPDRRRFPRGGRRDGDIAGRHPTVAIIERYHGVRRPVARYLEHFNFAVAEAADAERAVAVLQGARPAVVLIEADKSLAFETIYHQAHALDIPVISMISAFSDAETAHAEASGAAGVLLKPFTLGTMLDEIRRVLRARMAADAGKPGVQGELRNADC